jgi:hypothetical protein
MILMKNNNPKLSDRELQTLSQLESKAAIFDRHKSGCNVDAVFAATKAARAAYISNPSDDTLEKYGACLRAENHAINPTAPNFHRKMETVELGRARFLETEVKPVCLPILDRAIAASRKNLESVRKTEAEKISSATGHEFDETRDRSKALDQARARLQELESLAAGVAGTVKYLAAFRACFA